MNPPPSLERRYAIENYHLREPFASFLPGIAGPQGVPLWCFYANRGQGIASFGHTSKNYPILEFKPADQAYRDIPRLGFRTFVRRGGECWEPFGVAENDAGPNRIMSINRAGFALGEVHKDISVFVEYAGLPGEAYPALLRRVQIINISGEDELEVLDGLPRLIPRGIGDRSLKTMSTTVSAWIETDLSNPEIPAFRIRASMEDTFEVRPVEGCHFMAALARCKGKEQALKPAVDAAMVFGTDLSFDIPRCFREGGLNGVMATEPVLLGRYPAAFAGIQSSLPPGQTLELYSIYGYVANNTQLQKAAPNWHSAQWFEEKFMAYQRLVDKAVEPYIMHTAQADLDAYTAQTALDNTLRGGMPMVWGRGKSTRVYHLYSRKHGDMERDYNDFFLSPTRWSTGFGNYRDMNQNRRIDVAVQPRVNSAIIHQFMDFIQPDGYNPLIVHGGAFQLSTGERAKVLKSFPKLQLPEDGMFTPAHLAEANIAPEDFPAILGHAEYLPAASFGEGYWVDHWTYNLDLIDQYLRIFPDRAEELLFGEADYRWFDCPGIHIRPMAERFVKTNGKIVSRSHLIEDNAEGRFLALRSTLAEKLVVLALVKCASLGYEERGIEMETGRPGWYDALNGLPGLFGCSLSDGAELLRLLRTILNLAGEGPERPVRLFSAAWALLKDLRVLSKLPEKHARWLARQEARAAYRLALRAEPMDEPQTEQRTLGEALEFFREEECRLGAALSTAAEENGGLLPTYYRFEAAGWNAAGGGHLIPKKLERADMPLFLEGVVKQLKISALAADKKALGERVKKSPLYDEALGMYVLNASLDGQPASLGRARAFPNGWLENGSVWLHMEYKYLLELLRIGDGELFWAEARRMLIPFLDNECYGRSPYENSSFIASSRYAVKSCHGRGFVGRLSGATAEYLTMWTEFLLGQRPIVQEGGGWVFRPEPLIPADLFREDSSLEFVLFGAAARYENPDGIHLFAGAYSIHSMSVSEGGAVRDYGDCLPADELNKLRDGKISSLRVVFKRCP
ncbi:MAG: hypothetical protein B0D92_02680 [Spirochaeta sp. LUC14_002_19_P3]|nr:MAG: hypothetical protein B0D92_02680 [Spirochaeta sp. LUC14_002_19_P3]